MTKKYSYREKMYHDLRDKLRNNEDVTITDLSNALWLYEKAFEAYEKMFNERIEGDEVYRTKAENFDKGLYDANGNYVVDSKELVILGYYSEKPRIGGSAIVEKGIWIFQGVEE
ncbi:hypothetical protein GU68_05165 [Listeria monocytogenes]|uniref:hypothetical protein n=1 Tax=Listeria monocytogenes TaxID=1639 RepID=UPI000E71C886|nr:hypothetical protein [Listeria monocytogenes]EAC7667819.1 hypothetical protein [Listeria monocytogenes]EEP2015991.1 hypothetical protein [Listeria monocytogenes]PSA25041.1 hypothetical protein AF262_02625 [Listeria monocytogenes]RKB83226.1 hypothetical protein GU55_00519 [Listeria monocytogenes]